jgi:prolyl oligopeptidase PreP (S9A serine peptidase family)/phosphodiesterase/alkaline phosphatase D-like protein
VLQAATVGVPVTNEVAGSSVVDAFTALEDPANRDAAAWAADQEAAARKSLDALPTRQFLRDRISGWRREAGGSYRDFRYAAGFGFVIASDSSQVPGRLIRFAAQSLYSNRLDQASLVVDPATAGPGGGAWDIAWYQPSPDGSKVALMLQRAGVAERWIRVWDARTSQPLPDRLPGLSRPPHGSSVEWLPGSDGFLYVGTTTPPGLPRVLRHSLGQDPRWDPVEFTGAAAPAETHLELAAGPGRLWFAVTVRSVTRDETAHWLRTPQGEWRALAGPSDRISRLEFGRDPVYLEAPRDDGVYLLSNDHAPGGRLLRVPLSNPTLASATVVLPEAKEPLMDFRPAASGVYAAYLKSGGAEFRFYDLYEKEPLKTPVVLATATPTTLRECVVTRGDEVVYCREAFLFPREWYAYDPNRDPGRAFATPLYDPAPFDPSDVEVRRVTPKGPDGTKLPMFILQRRGTRQNGESPCVLTAESLPGTGDTRAAYDLSRRAWLDQGGIIAVAQVRGIGTPTSDWRPGGPAANLTLAVDDFAACARYLVNSNYTRPQRLAAVGTGMAGWLALSVATREPSLLQAVVADDAPTDLLRGPLFKPGGFLESQLGPASRIGPADALRGVSPYWSVQDRATYPAVLLRTSDAAEPSGARLPPGHPWKMAARLRQAGAGGSRVLLARVSPRDQTFAARVDAAWESVVEQYAFLFDRLAAAYSLVDRGPWSGAVTPRSATVKARLAGDGKAARLAVSRSPTLDAARFFGPAVSSAARHDIVAFDLDALEPGTQYYYALEIDGRLDPGRRGEFRTFPEGPASFRVAFASCAKTASANEVFDRIRENRPLFFMNTGDFHYLNITSNSIELYRDGYDLVLSSPEQADLYRSVPFVYMWDDHDYGGNNSNRKSPSHESARRAYEEYLPHYPLAAGGGDQPIYQSFSVGRVKFILTDLRSERDDVKKKDDATKSMMGPRQKEWFKQELLSANGRFPLICWVSSVPWLGQAGSNYYGFVKGDQYGFFHHTNVDAATRTNKMKAPVEEDHWCVFSTERREIADFIKTNHIRGVCVLHGDSHMLAADDGSNGDFATGGGAPLPVMCAAPLDQTPSLKGGPYSQGVYRVKPNEGCYGLLEITDRGEAIDVHYSGRNNEDKEKISLRFSVPALAPGTPP